MKNLNYLFAVSLLISGLALSCTRSYNNSSTLTTPTYSSMDTIFGMLCVQPKTVTADAGTANTFYGSSGTRYVFPANCFQTATGATVTGNVQINTAEYAQRGDMIFSKMLPVSNSEPLISGGEINVSASQNGKSIFMKPGTTFLANMPVTGTQQTGLAFFSGQANRDTTQFKTNWMPVNDSARPVAINPVFPDTLGIISDSLTECNADRFMSSPNFQNFTVTAQVNGASLTSTTKVYGYTLYDTYKGVWPLGLIGSYTNGVFTEEHVPNIPVHFVIFTLVNGKFYGGIGSATPISGQNYTVTLTNVDPTAFKAQVNAL